MLLQQVINGLTLGAVYTLIALSFSLVMGILGVLNLAIADLFMLGGYFGLTVVIGGHSVWLAIACAMVGAAILAFVVERVAYRPLRDAPVIMPLLSTIGFSIIFQNVALNLWGSDPLQLPDELFDERIAIGPASVGVMQVVVLAVAIILVAALAAIVQKTWLGRGLRAVAENWDVARLLGVPASRVVSAAFILSGLLSGAAGVLIGLHYSAITPFTGVDTGLKAIAVMVVGGVNRIWGVLIAGPLIGIIEVMSIVYGGSAARDMVVYGLMILVLLVRPQGLLGGTRTEGQRV
ncbi:MAG TPA: branched-chain amino acid ABC transporter permease [Alphaproteobacteria bacterium]